MDIDDTLAERGSRYGIFAGHAKITQDIKRAMQQGNWPMLADDQRECLEMIAHKVGRILNGDPDYHDSWHDIVGYTKLVADRLIDAPTPRPPPTALEIVLAEHREFPEPPVVVAPALLGEGLEDMSHLALFTGWMKQMRDWCIAHHRAIDEVFAERGWKFEPAWLGMIE